MSDHEQITIEDFSKLEKDSGPLPIDQKRAYVRHILRNHIDEQLASLIKSKPEEGLGKYFDILRAHQAAKLRR